MRVTESLYVTVAWLKVFFIYFLFWNVKIYVQQSNTAYQSTNLSMGCIKIRWHDWYSLEFFKLGGGKVYFPGRDQKKRKFYQERPPKWLNTEIPGWNWHGYGWLSIIRITGVGESELGSEQAPGTLHLRRRWSGDPKRANHSPAEEWQLDSLIFGCPKI